MNITKSTLLLLGALLVTPLIFCSCANSHPVAAGAAGAAAVNHYQDEQKKEDYAQVKKAQAEHRRETAERRADR
jgi:hypothetical protein